MWKKYFLNLKSRLHDWLPEASVSAAPLGASRRKTTAPGGRRLVTTNNNHLHRGGLGCAVAPAPCPHHPVAPAPPRHGVPLMGQPQHAP